MSATHSISEAQLNANRANSQHSTGPRTEEGKTRSRMNGWKHGLTGQTLVITDEERAEYEHFRAGILACLVPANALEEDLAQSIVMDRWRLNRIRAIEHNIFAMSETADEETFLATAKQLNLLSLYESRIGRGVERTAKQLKQLQAERKAEAEQEKAKRGLRLNEAALLYQLAEMQGLPFDHEADGFGFSTPEIRRAVMLQRAVAAQKHAQKRAA